MTEAEWLASEDPMRMWSYLTMNRPGERKFRLFAVGCCRRLWHLPAEDRHRKAVEVAEQFADGLASPEELVRGRATISSSYLSAVFAHAASLGEGHAAEWAIRGAKLAADEKAEHAAQSNLLRCIVGNPFRPASVDPAWLTPTVVGLARGIYDDRAFDRLPILADALQDAGCDHPDMLSHCRSDGPHARGCWVVDLILGKS